MKSFAMLAAALFLLAGCVVEDRVIIRDSHPRPYYYGYGHPHWQPAPSYWYRSRPHGRRPYGGHFYRPHRPYRW